MFKKILTLAVLPTLLFAQPAEARRLFWWQMTNPDGTAVSPTIYDDSVAPQDVYGPDPYATQQAAPDEQFNQDQYQLYRREMARRYHRNAYVDPYAAPTYAAPSYADPTPPPPYAAPIYPTKIKRKLVNKAAHLKPVVKKPVSTTAAAITPQLTTAAPVTTASTTVATPKPVPVKKSGAVTCEKGASIVSSFGFESVSTKSCDGGTLVYNASRGGKPFEINVSASSGELTAVKKL